MPGRGHTATADPLALGTLLHLLHPLCRSSRCCRRPRAVGGSNVPGRRGAGTTQRRTPSPPGCQCCHPPQRVSPPLPPPASLRARPPGRSGIGTASRSRPDHSHSATGEGAPRGRADAPHEEVAGGGAPGVARHHLEHGEEAAVPNGAASAEGRNARRPRRGPRARGAQRSRRHSPCTGIRGGRYARKTRRWIRGALIGGQPPAKEIAEEVRAGFAEEVGGHDGVDADEEEDDEHRVGHGRERCHERHDDLPQRRNPLEEPEHPQAPAAPSDPPARAVQTTP